MSLLGLDVGTTGTKAVAFNLDGRPIASAYREYPLRSPRPGWQELDPEEVWAKVRETLAEVAAHTKRDPIRSLAISAQGEACHAVDRAGRCLTPSVVTFDARTADMPRWWLERKSRFDLARISGMPLHGMYSLNKILWFRDNQPEIYAKAWKFLCYEDFVIHRLGIDPAISPSLAARTMALNAQSGAWSEEILGIADVDPDLLARVVPSGEAVGQIPANIADGLGLPRGVMVAAGGHDQPAGALGAGIIEPGEAVYAMGTVDCICPIFDRFAMTEDLVENNLCCYPSCINGLYASIAFNFTGGSLLRWYRDTFAAEEVKQAEAAGRDVYDLICEQVSPEPENLLILPHFTVTGTPHFDTASRGAILGLTLHSRRSDVIAAILSGVTYEMKLNLEVLRKAGVSLKRLRASGGGAKSSSWIQRKADIMGMPVAILETGEAASLGAALLGGKAAGLVPDLAQAAREWVRIHQVCEPDARRAAAFQKRFEIFVEVYPALREIHHRLTALDS